MGLSRHDEGFSWRSPAGSLVRSPRSAAEDGYIAPMPGLNPLAALPLIVFDDCSGSFGPLTDLRASFELRAGIGTLRERIERVVGRRADRLICRPALEAVVAESTGIPTFGVWPHGEILAVNGRLLTVEALAGITSGEVRVTESGVVVAARMESAALGAVEASALPAVLCRESRARVTVDAVLATAPWDLTTRIPGTLAEDLSLFRDTSVLAASEARALRPDEGSSFGSHAIWIDRTATIGPLCVLDASKGPIFLGANVVVRPLSVLVGPCAVLEGSTVAERSLLKASTVIGPHCRAGGEIGGTIFQGYSNKSHDGHLGDSFVGEWVNIGAGTDNSNLLNTYGEVIVRLDSDSGLTRTDRKFWGSILGDHVKLAIGTRLMTGATIGTGAMIAQSRPVASFVPRYSWIVDGGESPKFFRFDKFMVTARAMMARRGKTPSAAVEAVLRELHSKSVATVTQGTGHG